MATTFSLDDIRAAAEAQFGSSNFEYINEDGEQRELVLINPLRLPKKRRDALLGLQDELDADEADQEALMVKGLHLSAEDYDARTKKSKHVTGFVASHDGDLAVIATVFQLHQKAAQVGEASASQS